MTTHLDFLSQNTVNVQWRVLADLAMKGAIVLAAAWTLTLSMRRASAALRHLVWTLAIYGVLALPVLAALLPGWRILPVWMTWEPASAQPLAPQKTGPVIAGEIPRNFLPPDGLAAEASALDGNKVGASQADEKSLVRPPAIPPALHSLSIGQAPQRRVSPWNQVGWQSWVLIAWGCGTAVMLLPMLASLLGLWRLGWRAAPIESGSWDLLLRELTTRLKFPRSVILLRGQWQAMPMTWGIIRPKLLLPPEADHWPEDRRRVVLLHELAHIRRCDFLTQLIVHVARAVYWFNPLIWIASKQIAVESEGACDDLVVSQETKASDYAEHLLTVVARLREGALIPAAAIAMARSSKLEARLVGILDDQRNRRSLTPAGVVLATAMVISGVLPLAMLHSARADESKTTAPDPKLIHAADSAGPAKPDPAPKDGKEVHIDAVGSVAPYDRVPAGGGAAPVQPVPIVFSIPQNDVQSVVRKFDAHQTIIVDVYDGRDARKKLGHGSLVGIDNQMDEQTGTLKCKAVVTPIGDALLFPNQFVNVRLILQAKAGAAADANHDVLKYEKAKADAAIAEAQLRALQVRISGIVVDPDGNPMAGATVAPADGTGNSLTGDTSYSVPTAKDGTFAITLPPSGNAKYNLEAHDGNQAQWRTWANGVLPPIQTKAGDELKNVVIKLTRPATVRGHMNDESGKPLVDREVRASAADKLENRYYDPTTRTDKNGDFVLSFIRPGKQFIQAAPFFWCNVPPDGMTLELKEGQTNSFLVDLKEGETRTGLQLTGPASTEFPSNQEQLRRAIQRSEKSANENKAKGADGGKKQDDRPITQVKLEAARRELDITTKRFEAGMIDTLEYQAAKDRVKILEAELTGDAVRVAEVRLAAARMQLQIVEQHNKVGILTALDLEKAKSNVAIAEAELRLAVEKAPQSHPANDGATRPAAAPPKTAAKRAEAMKADIRNFKLDLQYNGPQDKPFYRLRLSVTPLPAGNRANPFDLQLQITEDQARKIIDHLAGDGFLAGAHDLHDWGFIPAASQPGYSLMVMQYYSDLGWKSPMLAQLDGLRSVLEGDAATSMDLLLGRLSGQRKQWKDKAAKIPEKAKE